MFIYIYIYIKQVLTSLSVKQEEIYNQAMNTNGVHIPRNATFSRKSATFLRQLSSSTFHDHSVRQQNQTTKTMNPSNYSFFIFRFDSTFLSLDMHRFSIFHRLKEFAAISKFTYFLLFCFCFNLIDIHPWQ